jgi:hypothetical protein
VRHAAALLFLAVAGLAAAQPGPVPRSVRAGDTLTVAEGKFADVTVEVPAGASVVWRFYPPPVQRADKLAPGRAIFAGERGKTYVVTAVVIDFDKKAVTDTEFAVTFAGKADPTPDPTPDPKPKPDPKPDPTPSPAKVVRVVLVYESGATLSAKHFGVLYGRELEEYLAGRCGASGWGRRDKDTDPAHDTSALKAVWAAGRGKVTSVPGLLMEADGRLDYQPLPLTAAAAIALVKKHAGDN